MRTQETTPFYIRTTEGATFYVETLEEALQEFAGENGYRLTLSDKNGTEVVIRRDSIPRLPETLLLGEVFGGTITIRRK